MERVGVRCCKLIVSQLRMVQASFQRSYRMISSTSSNYTPPPLVSSQPAPTGMFVPVPMEYVVEENPKGTPRYPSELPPRLQSVVSAADYYLLARQLEAIRDEYLSPPVSYYVLMLVLIVCPMISFWSTATEKWMRATEQVSFHHCIHPSSQ